MFNTIIKKIKYLHLIYEVKDIPYGKAIKLSDGTIVNVYDSDKIVIQGKETNKAIVKQLLGLI